MKTYRKHIVSILALSAAILATLNACDQQPSRVDQRKEEIRKRDSLELASAQTDLQHADSVIAFKEFELEDLKKSFVFEKQEKYQTMGNYVLPQHSGSKTQLTFFPEVEESGKLLFVCIDRQRKYSFIEVDITADSDIENLLPKGVSQKDREAVRKCVELATLMSDLKVAKEKKEKAGMKIKFYEKKKEKQGY